MLNLLPIYERFHAFQGEGVHMGRSAFFIRTYGCPVKCPWCDSAGTWHKDWVPKDVHKMSVQDLVTEVYQSRADFVVVTGGEPAVHDLSGLTQALRNRKIPSHLETSGAFEIKGTFDWVTLSPKRWKPPIQGALIMADEFKFIIEDPADIEFYWNLIQVPHYAEARPIWLHPEWSHHYDPIVLGAISDAVKANGSRFRAGWQLHKLYQVDYRDARTQSPIPLGGNLLKGY